MRLLCMHELYGYLDDNIIRKLRKDYNIQVDGLNTFGFSNPMRPLLIISDQLHSTDPRFIR